MSAFEQYEHHGKKVWVRKDLKGQHRTHCLCFQCAKFNLNDREANCPIANALYRFDILAGVVTPVWECRHFVSAEGEEPQDTFARLLVEGGGTSEGTGQ